MLPRSQKRRKGEDSAIFFFTITYGLLHPPILMENPRFSLHSLEKWKFCILNIQKFDSLRSLGAGPLNQKGSLLVTTASGQS